jgi:hypothetical protein
MAPIPDPHRFWFEADGTLHHGGRDGWREPICPVCSEPIHYCLDMFSFTIGTNPTLAHARCVWTKPAFLTQARRAPEGR